MKKLVQGHGVNDANYSVTTRVNGKKLYCPYYQRWRTMLGRAYSPAVHAIRPTYKNVTVCDDWLSFTNFRLWMVDQDWSDKELDKDIIEPGNTVYCPDKCCFVSGALNSLLHKNEGLNSAYPRGGPLRAAHFKKIPRHLLGQQ